MIFIMIFIIIFIIILIIVSDIVSIKNNLGELLWPFCIELTTWCVICSCDAHCPRHSPQNKPQMWRSSQVYGLKINMKPPTKCFPPIFSGTSNWVMFWCVENNPSVQTKALHSYLQRGPRAVGVSLLYPVTWFQGKSTGNHDIYIYIPSTIGFCCLFFP